MACSSASPTPAFLPAAICEAIFTSGPTLGMLVEMLVERVFLVVELLNCFLPFQKKIREFFCFSPRTKESKAGLRGNFQIVSFPYGNVENMFYNFVVFFSSVRHGGRNSKRVHRTCSVKNGRRKFYACHRTSSVIFFLGGRKFYA